MKLAKKVELKCSQQQQQQKVNMWGNAIVI